LKPNAETFTKKEKDASGKVTEKTVEVFIAVGLPRLPSAGYSVAARTQCRPAVKAGNDYFRTARQDAFAPDATESYQVTP
jgi:hypothetical protein